MNREATGPDWVCVTEKAAWQARDSQGEMVWNGHMWILGGWFTPQTPNPRDVWKSSDGKNWTRTVEVAPWEHGDLPATMPLQRQDMADGRAEIARRGEYEHGMVIARRR